VLFSNQRFRSAILVRTACHLEIGLGEGQRTLRDISKRPLKRKQRPAIDGGAAREHSAERSSAGPYRVSSLPCLHLMEARTQLASSPWQLEPIAANVGCGPAVVALGPQEGEQVATILITEDDAQVLVLAEAILQDAGHRTFSAAGVAEALAILGGDALIDILFTDIHLKSDERGGLEVAAEAIRIRPSISVLYTTGAQVTDGMRALLVEGSALLPKPYVPSDLVGAVETLAP